MCANSNDGETDFGDQLLRVAQQHRPSYRVIPVLNTPEISGGDDIVIEIYLSGYGVPEKAKLHVVYSGIEVSKSASTTMLTAGASEINSTDENGNEVVFRGGGEATGTENLEKSHLIFIPDLPLFYPTDAVFGENSTGFTAPPSHSELEYPGDNEADSMISPITLTIPTRSDHTPGDYNIELTLTTTDKHKNVYTTKETVSVRVQDWVERNNKKLRAIAVFLAIVTTGLAISSFTLDIVDFFNLL